MAHSRRAITLAEFARAVGSAMKMGSFSEESTTRLLDLMARFVAFANGSGVVEVEAVSASLVESFVHSRARDGTKPAVATMHFRRTAVRLLFGEGRRLGLTSRDPTLDIRLPSRTSLCARPLTDDEVELCRSYSVRTMTETRQPTAWALAEATARSAELAHIRVEHLDLDSGRIWIPGSSKTQARWGHLTSWGSEQIDRRMKAFGRATLDAPLVCPTASVGVSATSSASNAIAATLRRAGLHRERDVRPPSVAAWAGAKAFTEGTPIQEVAHMLGIRSLDRAAAFIGFDWRGGEAT
jgi:integrase/recombinase XerC